MNILTGRINPVRIMFAPERESGGALEAGNFHSGNISSEDEIPLELGDDGPLPGGNGQPEIPPSKPAEESGTKEAAPPDDAQSRARDNKGRFTSQEEQFPDIEPSKPGDQTEAKAEHQPAAKQQGQQQPAQPKTEAKTPEPEKKPEIPATDDDIDKLEPKPTASEKTKSEFRTLKEIGKSARLEARTAKARVAELEQKLKDGSLTDEMQAKLKKADEDANFRAMFELENDPAMRAAYAKKLGTVEENIFKLLQDDPRLAMSKERVDKLREAGIDSEEGQRLQQWIFKTLRDKGKDLLLAEVVQAFHGRQNVIKERAAEIEGLRTNRDAYLKQRQEGERNEYSKWGKTADETLTEICNGEDWVNFKDVPENATAEQKAIIEAHNAKVKNEIAPKFNQAVLDVYKRDPKATSTHIFRSFKLDHVQGRLDTAESELKQARERIAELEKLAGGVRRVSQVSRADQAPSGKVPSNASAVAGSKEVDAEEALDNYLLSIGRK